MAEQAAAVTEGGPAWAQRARASGNDHCVSKKAFESNVSPLLGIILQEAIKI